MFLGHRRHQTWQRLPVSHYNRSLLSRSDQASNKPLYRCCAWQKPNHQTSSGAKWQITPLPVWESLFHSLCPLSFPFLIFFVSLSTSYLFLPRGLSSLSFLTPLLPRCLSLCLSLRFHLCCPSSLSSYFHIPPSPRIYRSVCPSHPVISGRAWQLGRGREWTMTYSPLSL